MNRQDKAAAGMLAGVKAGHLQARLDKRLAADIERAGEVAMMPLEKVLDRVGGLDTREPTPDALDALAESINALGLLEPLVVDKVGRLLAGKTRLLAVRLLAEKDPDRWAKVPVRRMDFDADIAPARALAVEVAENEQRRDYTGAEVRALAGRLTAAGFKATAGRPRKGTKALLPALGAVVGKSKRQLLRILDPEPAKRKPAAWPGAVERLRLALAAFGRAAAAVPRAKLTPGGRRAVRLAAQLQTILEGEPDAKK